MLCRALKISLQEEDSCNFKDQDEISSWAKSSVLALVDQKFFRGSDGRLRPKDKISRAETAALLDHGIALIDGSSTAVETDKVCIINQDHLILKECAFTRDVFVAGNVKELVLEHVSATGKIYVLSRYEKAVTLKNCSFNTIETLDSHSVCDVTDPKKEETDELSETITTEQSSESDDEITSDHFGDISNEGSAESGENAGEQNEASHTGSDQNVEHISGDAVSEESKPTIVTTLADHLLQRNSKKVFDVIAKDASGNKIACNVRCNDINIEPSWDDENKTSFTLEFIDSGEYVVVITAKDTRGIAQSKTCYITYEAADYGEAIGTAFVCIEAFTVGGGYIVPPQEIDVLEGVNCAHLLDGLLESHQLHYMSTGSLDGGFYLSAIQGIPDFTPAISSELLSALTDAGFAVEIDNYTPHQLSEFDFTQGSGWMYSVNGIYPNVGFSEYYLQEGDVVRIQYTLAYGSDIGGASGAGYSYSSDFFEPVNRNELIKIIAKQGIETCQDYIDLIVKPNMTVEELDYLIGQLQ